jgi:very-short-patch-repair endonuclease
VILASRNPNHFTPPGRFAATLPIEGREGAGPSHGRSDELSIPVASRGQEQRKSRRAIAQAKTLLQRLTGPEAKLWLHLKRLRTIDTHFRKQAPIGPYIADFACLRARLIIEIDGEQHGRHAGRVRDYRRDNFLKSQGFKVLRFWNNEVLQQTEAVLDTIYSELHGAVDALPRSTSKRRDACYGAPSSPSMGEVVRLAGPEGVTILSLSENLGES